MQTLAYATVLQFNPIMWFLHRGIERCSISCDKPWQVRQSFLKFLLADLPISISIQFAHVDLEHLTSSYQTQNPLHEQRRNRVSSELTNSRQEMPRQRTAKSTRKMNRTQATKTIQRLKKSLSTSKGVCQWPVAGAARWAQLTQKRLFFVFLVLLSQQGCGVSS